MGNSTEAREERINAGKIVSAGKGEVVVAYSLRPNPRKEGINNVAAKNIVRVLDLLAGLARSARLGIHTQRLLAGEALEIGHLALHLFACGVGGGADALDAELEFVWVGGARQGFVEGD